MPGVLGALASQWRGCLRFSSTFLPNSVHSLPQCARELLPAGRHQWVAKVNLGLDLLLL